VVVTLFPSLLIPDSETDFREGKNETMETEFVHSKRENGILETKNGILERKSKIPESKSGIPESKDGISET
jgi:hypothetical protein